MSELHLQGIVFDADGTLFDTERLARTVWLSVAREWKATAIEEHYIELIGRNREGIVALLRAVCPPEFPLDEFLATCSQRSREKLNREGVPVKEGARELLEFCVQKQLPVALATSSAQLLSALLCLIYICKKLSFLRIRRQDMHLEPTLMRLTASYGAVAALQQSSLYLGKLMVQSAVNAIGTDAISAFTATTRIENFSQAFGISGCEAIAIFVAQNQGAKEYRRAKDGFLRGMAIVTGIGVVFSFLLALFGEPLVTIFLDEPVSITLGTSYLRLMGYFYFLSFIGHSFVGHYRGIGRMNITFFGTTLQIVVRVVCTYLLVDLLGLDAVALATGLGWVVIVLFHSSVYLLECRGIGYRLPETEEP